LFLAFSGLSAPLRAKPCLGGGRPDGNRWKIRDDVRRMVRFTRMNLIDPWPQLPAYDVILLRNVLIYFDVESKRRILDNVARQLQPGGYLIMGSAETPIGLCPQFQTHRIGHAVLYRLTQR
jgi:chemotaxis protein methyltransferase CheR